MKIQSNNLTYTTQPRKNVDSKVSPPVIKSGLQSDAVSFSSHKPQKAGFLKALAVSLGALTLLTGCGGENGKKIDSKTRGETSYSTFAGNSGYDKNNKEAGNLGLKLLEYGDKADYETIEKEINNFFEDNGITNVNIKDISKSPEIPSNLMGAFIPQYNDDMEYIGGTMYIGRPENFSDEKERIKYAEEVSHELTHVLQFQKDKTNQGLKGLVNSSQEADFIFKTVNNFKQTQAVNYARNAALSDYVLNSMTSEDYKNVVENINEYGMAFYDKEINITDSGIKDAVVKTITGSSSQSFDSTVNSVTDEYLNKFASNFNGDKEKQTQMKKALLSNIVFNYRAEAEAYRTSTMVEEAALGIKGDSLSDFVPKTYDEIAEVLERKLKTEY